MYPEATFFSLIRNPVALYEGHKRHHVCKGPEHFVDYYLKITEKMLEDYRRHANCHLVRFEDLLEHPVQVLKQVYDLAGLDLQKVQKVRLKAKPHLTAEGQRETPYGQGRHYWFELDELCAFLEPNINQYQKQQLSLGEIQTVKSLCASRMADLDYQ
jgi:hypothetical protein